MDYDNASASSLTLPPLNWGPVFTQNPFYAASDFAGNEFSDRYISLLSYFTRIEENALLHPNDQVHTWLKRAGSDDFLDIDIDKYPHG